MLQMLSIWCHLKLTKSINIELTHFFFVWLKDSDIGDYDYELSLEMKRQKIQRELMKLEQENLEKREEIVIKKDEAPIKTRATAMSKVSH